MGKRASDEPKRGLQGADLPSDTVHLRSGGGTIYLVSDIHLGDGSHADAFLGKDREFLAFLDRVEQDGVALVVLGDALDFEQAWYFRRIVEAHGPLLERLTALSRKMEVVYVYGNHDPDVHLWNHILELRLAREVVLDDHVLCVHGWEYDSYVGERFEESSTWTRIITLYERVFRTWVRLPLRDYYTFTNRVVHWAFAWLALYNQWQRGIGALVGRPGWGRRLHEFISFWARAENGDPMGITKPALAALAEHPTFHTVICGHSHVPGVVRTEQGRYANLGSWTFGSSQYGMWDGEEIRIQDWITSRRFADEHYRHIFEGRADWTYLEWFQDQYMGWLRFRCGEEALRMGVRPRPWVMDRPLGSLAPLPLLTETQTDNVPVTPR